MSPERHEIFTTQQDITYHKIRSAELRMIFYLSDAWVRRTASLPFSVGRTAWMRELYVANRTTRTGGKKKKTPDRDFHDPFGIPIHCSSFRACNIFMSVYVLDRKGSMTGEIYALARRSLFPATNDNKYGLMWHIKITCTFIMICVMTINFYVLVGQPYLHFVLFIILLLT
jgi:hypothetical protein